MKKEYALRSKAMPPKLRAKERNRISALESRINKRKTEESLKTFKDKVISSVNKLDELIDAVSKEKVRKFYAPHTVGKSSGKNDKFSDILLRHLQIERYDPDNDEN